jgi:FkbM family methyltransferase
MIERSGWFFPNIDSHFEKQVAEYPNTAYQQESINQAYSFVKNFNNAIDIGANVGLHSVRFAQKFKKVVSFEPVSINFECLKKNTLIFDNITHFNCGLGDSVTTTTISIPGSYDNCGAYSIVDFVDSKEELVSEEISIERLDNFNLEVDLIKIDTQGFEVPVLTGGMETLKRCSPVLILECETKKDFSNVSEILTPLGYQCVGSVKKDKIWVRQ